MPHRTPLGNLIQSALDANGWSARHVEEISAGKPGLGRGNLSNLKNKRLASIKGETLVSLAEILGLPTELVLRAALRSLKTPIELQQSSGTPEDAINLDPQLSVADKQTLLGMLGYMRSKTGDGHEAAPMNQAEKAPSQPQMGTEEDALTPGEDGYIAPPADLYRLAASDAPSEGRERRRQLDDTEGA